MSGSVNKVILVGHLGKDPEVRSFDNGGRIVTFRVATSESWRDKASGERKERTEWHTVSITNEGIGKIAEQYLRKGSKVYVEGQLETRKWQDQSGADRYSAEIAIRPYRGELTLLDGRNENGGQRGEPQAQQQRQTAPAQGGGYAGGLDDSIPFAPEWR